jgi:uncharacterized protein
MNRNEYWDPYVAGVALGLVLLAAFVVMGRGLGASGAFASVATAAANAVTERAAAASPFYSRYLADGGPWRNWLLFEIAGAIAGGFASALFAGRLRIAVDGGPRVASRSRLAFAFAGGGLMGGGAVLARGCTSGLALTGGALLAAGSWIFIGAAFAAGYATAPLVRGLWR